MTPHIPELIEIHHQRMDLSAGLAHEFSVRHDTGMHEDHEAIRQPILDALQRHDGWKPADLARASGVSQPTVSKIMNKQVQMSPETCKKLACLLNVAADQFMEVAGHRTSSRVQADAPSLGELADQLAAEAMEIRRRATILEQQQEDAVLSRHQHDAIRTHQHVAGGADPDGGVTLAEEADEDVFSVIVMGECLYPQVEPDDVLILSRSNVPQIGDIVSVIVNGERHIKLVHQKGGGLLLYSRRGELRLPSDGAGLEGVVIRHTRDVMANKMSIKTKSKMVPEFDIGSGDGLAR